MCSLHIVLCSAKIPVVFLILSLMLQVELYPLINPVNHPPPV